MLKLQHYRSIKQVPTEAWDLIAPRENVGLESRHLEALEISGINNIQPHYLLASSDGNPAGIAYFFIMNLDLSSLSKDMSPEIRKTVKCWHPDFMNLKMVECGLISGLGETIATDGGDYSDFRSLAAMEMERIGKEAGADIILIRDIPHNKRSSYKALGKDGFIPVHGYPISIMDLKWDTFEGYLDALKTKRRRNIKSRIASLKAPEITPCVIQDFGEYADRLEYLWKQVNQKVSEYDHEQLTASYFKEINRCLPDRSLIVAIKRKGEIAAFVLCLEGDKEFFAAHTGMDYQYNNQYELYFNLHFLAIKNAIERWKKWINFGITSYEFKLLIGCELLPVVYFVKHIADPELTPALADLMRSSIIPPENPFRPFRDQDISNRVQPGDAAKELQEAAVGERLDVFNKAYSYIRTDKMKVAEIYSFFPPFESAQEAIIQYRGKEVVMLGTNSYLGLSTHPEVRAAAKEAIDKYGTGVCGAPVLNGTLDIHEDLACSIARFMQKESALLFSTGYQANLGVISAIAGRHDVIILDNLNHASIIDGSNFSFAKVLRYEHDDMEDMERTLQKFPERAKFVVVDSVFSMEGTIANLPAIVKLSKKYGARIMLDEAHGLGVLGPGGRGAAEHFGLLGQIDIVMGTFSKSFAGMGGFVASSSRVINFLRHNSRSHLFSASLTPPVVASVRKALDIIIREPERRAKVLKNAEFMARGLRDLGYDARFLGTAIVPVRCGDELLTLAVFKKLFDEGVYANPVLPPAVPKGQELLRTSYMATHDEKILSRGLEVFARIRTTDFPLRREYAMAY